MPRAKLLVFAASCATIAGAMTFSMHIVHGQSQNWQPAPQLPPYNPYPPGILPSNIASEELRIQREVTGIENEAIGRVEGVTTDNAGRQPANLSGQRISGSRSTGKAAKFRPEHVSL